MDKRVSTLLRMLIIICITAGAMILWKTQTSTASTEFSANISDCTDGNIFQIICKNDTIVGYLALPKSTGNIWWERTDDGYTIFINPDGGAGCIHKITINNATGVITIRTIENNIPFTIAKIDSNNCSWLLR